MAGDRNGDAGRADGQVAPPASSERTPLLRALGGTDGGTDGGTNGAAQQHGDDERTVVAKDVSFARLALIMGTAWLGVFLGAIDSTIIATLSAPIASEFRSLSLLSWLATAYLISNAACQPISGRLTDIFGRGPGLVFSNVLFAAGNLICGLARDEYVMILGRVVAGIGGGGLMSISTFLGSDLIPLRQRGVVQGIGNVCYGSGAMLGGIFGGWINDHTAMGWRLAFLIQVPPVLASAVAVALLVKVPPKQSDKSFLARIDFVGVFLTSSFLVLLLLGLNSGGNQVPWTHPLPLITIPLSAVTFIGFIWWESRARQPIIPVKLLLDRTVLAACFCNMLCTMVVMAGLFYVPLYLQVLGDSATGAGIKILPSPVGVSICSVGAGYLMKRTGRYVGLGIASLVTLILGIVLFTLQGRDSPLWLTGVAFFFVGGGYGAMLTITLLACIAAVDHSQQAVVTSATYLARSLGGTVGMTIGSAVYQNILKAQLWDRFGDHPGAAEEIQRIRDDLNELKHLPEGWYDGVMDSFMEAFRGVWLTMLAMAVGALICIAMIRQHTLHATLERR
ncbi:Multidrug resistance protein fnx1 [Tolypocladium capitatum]|uniref:Multidrug resistance protein fnx1 n=1 Tax=Tolypocladium capitatum TaxID=45235 RepID=A0A2K3QJM9_9HYPO|nr:Multidrug resistance protein fnx1 [Tolypocladium capitatum]